MRDVPIQTFGAHFGYTEWDVRDLFIQGTPLLERKVDQVALGSLLHLVQDSFADGHVDRESPVTGKVCSLLGQTVSAPGRIRQFHAYGTQDHDAHARADSIEAKDRHLLATPDVVDIGRPIVAAFDERATWDAVRPYFECVFELSERATPSSAGENFAISG
jgi:hypothetical protein